MVQLKNGLAALALALTFSCGGSKVAVDKDDKAPAFDGVTEASALSDGWTQVSWDAADDDVSDSSRIVYRVYVGVAGAPVDYTARVAVSPAGATSVGVPGLPQGVDLEIAVRAVDEKGNEDTGTRTVKLNLVDTYGPQFAGVSKVEGKSGSSVEVSWPEATDQAAVTGYWVYLSETPTPVATAKAIKVSAEKRSLVIEQLKEATTYYAAVRSIDAAGNDDRNRKVVSGSTLDVTAPDFAGITSATPGGTAVRLIWPEASDLVTAAADLTYNIYASENSAEHDYTTPLATVQGTTTYLISGLAPSTEYHFVVRAEDAAGNEDDNEVEQTVTTGTMADTTPPNFAGIASAVTKTSVMIELNWAAATDDQTDSAAIVYDIWVSTTDAGQVFTDPPAVTSAPGATAYNFDGLDPNTKYFFVVRARNIAELSDPNTNQASATTKSDDDAPVFAGPTAVTGLSPTSFRVSWDAAVDAFAASSIKYDVYVATTSGAQNYAALPTKSVTGALFLDILGQTRSTTYYVVVRASDPDGNMVENTIEVAGATLADTTGPVMSGVPSLTTLSQTSIKVDWAAATDDSYPANQLRYQVFYSTAVGGPFSSRPVTGFGAITDTITGLAVNTQYYVYVVARDGVPNLGVATPNATVFTSSDNTAPIMSAVSLTGTSSSSVNTITLSWTAATDDFSSAGNIYYEICRSTVDEACDTFSVYTNTSAGATSIALGSQTLGQRYYYKVRAVDQAGNRGTTADDVTDATAPSAPATPTPYSTPFIGAYFYTYWTATSDSQFNNLRYRLEYWGDDWVSGTSCSSSAITGTSYTNPQSVTPGLTAHPAFVGANYVRVVAIDGFGNEGYSSWYYNYYSAGAASGILQPLWNAQCAFSGCHGPSGYPAWTPAVAKQVPSPVGYGTAAMTTNSTTSRMIVYTTTRYMPPVGYTAASDQLMCNLIRWSNAGLP